MKALSERQNAILAFLNDFEERKGYPPSVRDIQKGCDISSTSVVDYNLRLLEQRGHIRRDREVSRGIEILGGAPSRNRESKVPILGTIAAGEPISVPDSSSWESQAEDWLSVPESMLRGKDGVFGLRVRGVSMIEDLINDGDVVLIQGRPAADNGETVVAWLKGSEETTLKKFYLEGGRVRLQPANATLAPRFEEPENVEIQGVVVGVLRDVG